MFREIYHKACEAKQPKYDAGTGTIIGMCGCLVSVILATVNPWAFIPAVCLPLSGLAIDKLAFRRSLTSWWQQKKSQFSMEDITCVTEIVEYTQKDHDARLRDILNPVDGTIGAYKEKLKRFTVMAERHQQKMTECRELDKKVDATDPTYAAALRAFEVASANVKIISASLGDWQNKRARCENEIAPVRKQLEYIKIYLSDLKDAKLVQREEGLAEQIKIDGEMIAGMLEQAVSHANDTLDVVQAICQETGINAQAMLELEHDIVTKTDLPPAPLELLEDDELHLRHNT